MSAIRINPAITFYATPAEVAGWISRWKKQHNLYYVFGRVFPTPGLAQDVDWDDPSAIRKAVEEYEVLFFRTDPFDVGVTSVNQIPRRNPDHLHINLPSLGPKGLRWGSLGSVSKKPQAVELWKNIASELLDRTVSGAWFDVPGRGKPAYEEGVRYSRGAASVWRDGTVLLGGGKTVITRLDGPKAEKTGRESIS
ncbi:MAG: hypothetical protein JO112_06485 [Planctomycetes bacterium]|nr:hypothetical protein [Planctomycetota bacterium]